MHVVISWSHNLDFVPSLYMGYTVSQTYNTAYMGQMHASGGWRCMLNTSTPNIIKGVQSMHIQ